VARQHGFDSWQAFKIGLSTVSDHAKHSPSEAVIICAEPELFVADIKASLDFFTHKLGFSIAFSYGEPPFYAQRDAAQLNLKCVDSPVINPELRDRDELLSAAMTVATPDEIKQLFLEFQSANVTFFQTLKKQPWGPETSSSKTQTEICCFLRDPPSRRLGVRRADRRKLPTAKRCNSISGAEFLTCHRIFIGRRDFSAGSQQEELDLSKSLLLYHAGRK